MGRRGQLLRNQKRANSLTVKNQAGKITSSKRNTTG
jgi:hypothetical protein